MNNRKLSLYIFGLIYAITLGSFVYIFPSHKDLWFFLDVICLPAIYMIGYEILMDRQRRHFNIIFAELDSALNKKNK